MKMPDTIKKTVSSTVERAHSNLIRWIFERFTFGQALDIFAAIWFICGAGAAFLVRG